MSRLTLALLAVPLAAAACGGGGGGSAAPSSSAGSTQARTTTPALLWVAAAPRTAVGRAAAKTEAGGGHVTVRGTIVSSDTSTIAATGVYAAPAGAKLDVRVHTPVTGAAVDASELFAGSTLYMQSHALSSYLSGAQWLSIDLRKAPPDQYATEDPLPFTAVDPQLTLNTLRAATSEQKIGPGHYRVVIPPALARKLAQGPYVASLRRQTLDAWIDKAGRVVRIASSASYVTGGTPRPIAVRLTWTFQPRSATSVAAPGGKVADKTSQAVAVFRDAYVKATVPG